jgi:hypothetical protein
MTDDAIDLRFLIREPAEVYHARSRDYVTAHALNDFRRCPVLYRKKQMGVVPERDSAAYVVGRAAHTLILEARVRRRRADQPEVRPAVRIADEGLRRVGRAAEPAGAQ